MTNCILKVLPSDTSPQFFYRIPADDDATVFCLESTSEPGKIICVEDSEDCQVLLKQTTTDDVQTHFIRQSLDVSIIMSALRNPPPCLSFSGFLGDRFSGRSSFGCGQRTLVRPFSMPTTHRSTVPVDSAPQTIYTVALPTASSLSGCGATDTSSTQRIPSSCDVSTNRQLTRLLSVPTWEPKRGFPTPLITRGFSAPANPVLCIA